MSSPIKVTATFHKAALERSVQQFFNSFLNQTSEHLQANFELSQKDWERPGTVLELERRVEKGRATVTVGWFGGGGTDNEAGIPAAAQFLNEGGFGINYLPDPEGQGIASKTIKGMLASRGTSRGWVSTLNVLGANVYLSSRDRDRQAREFDKSSVKEFISSNKWRKYLGNALKYLT